MATVGSLLISLEARTDKLEKELKKARGDLARTQREMKKIGAAAKSTERDVLASFGKMGGGIGKVTKLLGTLSAAAGVSFSAQFIKQTIEAGDAIGKTADKLGLGVEALQEYRFAAERSGVASNTFDMAVQRFGRRVAEAAQGTGEAKTALQQLNIPLRDNQGNLRSVEALLGDVADRWGLIPTQLDKNRIAMKLFDSEGVVMTNLLREGSEGMAALRKEARDLGTVVSEKDVRAFEEANDKLSNMAKVVQGVVMKAVANLNPLIVAGAESFERIVKAIHGSTTAMSELTANEQGTVEMLRSIGAAANWAAGAFQTFANFVADAAKNLGMARLDKRIAEIQKQIADEEQKLKPFELFGFIDVGKGAQGAEADAIRKRIRVLKAELGGLNRELDNIVRNPGSSVLFPDRPGNKTTKKTPAGIGTIDLSAGQGNDTADALRKVRGILNKLRTDHRQAFDEKFADLMKKQADEAAKLTEKYKEQGRTITQQLETPLEHLQRRQEELNDVFKNGGITQDILNRGLKQAQSEFNRTTAAGEGLISVAEGIKGAFQQSFAGVIQGTQSLADAVDNMLTSMGLSIAQNFLGKGIDKLLNSALSAGSSGGGGFGGLLGGLFGATAMAGGGMVTSPTLALLGENPGSNPEFVLNRRQMSSLLHRKQGNPINVNINVTTPDANSFRASEGQIMGNASRALQRALQRNG